MTDNDALDKTARALFEIGSGLIAQNFQSLAKATHSLQILAWLDYNIFAMQWKQMMVMLANKCIQFAKKERLVHKM